MRSDQLFTEIKFVIENFGEPLTQLFEVKSNYRSWSPFLLLHAILKIKWVDYLSKKFVPFILTRCFSNGMIIRTTVMNLCFIHSRPVEFQSSTERDFQWYYPPVIMVLPNSTSQVHSWPGNTSARGTARSRCISPQDNLQLAGNDRQMFLLPELSRLTGVLRRQHGTMVSQVPAIVKTAEQAPLYRCEYDLYKPISELLWNLIV